jgi:hypothetical protein
MKIDNSKIMIKCNGKLENKREKPTTMLIRDKIKFFELSR